MPFILNLKLLAESCTDISLIFRRDAKIKGKDIASEVAERLGLAIIEAGIETRANLLFKF